MSYEDHIFQVADNIAHLLSHKQECLLPKGLQLTKSALLDIAKIFNHDTTPTIPALCKPSESSIYSSDILTSKGENPSTKISSKGGGNTDTFFPSLDDRIKRKSHLTP